MPVAFSAKEAVAPEVTTGASFEPVIAKETGVSVALPAGSTARTVKLSLAEALAANAFVSASLLLSV